MTQEEVIELAKEAGLNVDGDYFSDAIYRALLMRFANLVAEKEREALEAELLKLKKGVASNSEYIQGRWDLIGEFQDVIRARKN